MEIKDLIKFEPIDLTHITITFGLALIVIYAFKTQLNSFFDTLQDRPITVTMSGSETKIELDSPVKPELLAESISNPQGSEQDFRTWEQRVKDVNNIDQFPKLGFGDLYNNLSSLNEGDLAVINYTVDNPSKKYFQDEAMLKYLSVASQKIRYLAFYKNRNFVGMISIKDVISGMASKDYAFNNFGEKIKNGKWVKFPHLIGKEVSFEETPSVKDLYKKLSETELSEIPLLSNGRLLGLLNHKSISDELYTQVSKS
tara:strand:+ start:10816 stop:11583 length:768 start_codon:yes stop_codon:yes gene_type:complete